jgi:hypothetical protein
MDKSADLQAERVGWFGSFESSLNARYTLIMNNPFPKLLSSQVAFDMAQTLLMGFQRHYSIFREAGSPQRSPLRNKIGTTSVNYYATESLFMISASLRRPKLLKRSLMPMQFQMRSGNKLSFITLDYCLTYISQSLLRPFLIR